MYGASRPVRSCASWMVATPYCPSASAIAGSVRGGLHTTTDTSGLLSEPRHQRDVDDITLVGVAGQRSDRVVDLIEGEAVGAEPLQWKPPRCQLLQRQFAGAVAVA